MAPRNSPRTDPLPELVRELKQQSLENPHDAVVRYNLGVAYNELGKPGEAIGAYRSAIEIDPGYALPHYNLGCTLLELGLPEEAKSEFDQMIELAPTMAEGFFMLGTVCGVLGMPEQLIRATKVGLQIAPDSSQACLNIGLASNRLGDFRQAVEFLTRSIALDADNAAAYVELVKAHRGLGDVCGEIRACRGALEIQGDLLDTWFHLGAAYLKKLRGPDSQVDYIETNGDFDLDDPIQLFYFSLGLLAMGMKGEARGLLSKLETIAPAAAEELSRFIDSKMGAE